jgi:hypothetical protein
MASEVVESNSAISATLLSLIIADELNNINMRSTYVPGLVNALLHG